MQPTLHAQFLCPVKPAVLRRALRMQLQSMDMVGTSCGREVSWWESRWAPLCREVSAKRSPL
jgi:hypothetical protein